MQSLQFTERLWTVATRLENYQGENRVKLNVMHCETLNWEREHIDTVWKEVIRLETEMEISHEEEWGIICLLDSLTNYHLCLQPYDLLPHCVDMLNIPV